LKSPQTYQLISPQEIGLSGYRLLLGKLSGRHALEDKLTQLGLKFKKKEMGEFSRYFKDHAVKKKFITDDDVINLFDKFQSKREEEEDKKLITRRSNEHNTDKVKREMNLIKKEEEERIKESKMNDNDEESMLEDY
jgi:isopropylmalate/homocitrate/citramalate synthase